MQFPIRRRAARPSPVRDFFARLAFLSFAILNLAAGESTNSIGGAKQGAELLKTDILGVFAHPDDETGVAATLAYYALDRHATVVTVYCTRGEGGGNMVGTQSGAALGILREAELRDCLGTLGVQRCYFLDQLDWAYTESVAATLKKWGKESTLERLVRLVRSLRPDVIVTMNPAPTPGQHGHHQAAAVLATEAFAAAADPHRFPLQLTLEGLEPWQPRKLFYGGENRFATATIVVNRPLPDGKNPAQIAGEALVHHRSQAFGNFNNSPWFARPQKFSLVKSFVPLSRVMTDLLDGLPATGPIDRLMPIGESGSPPLVTLEFLARPAEVNYRHWIQAQGIERVATTIQADPPVVAGEANRLELQIHNPGAAPVEGTITLRPPDGWQVVPLQKQVRAAPGATLSLSLQVTPPSETRRDQELTAQFVPAGSSVMVAATAKCHPLPRTRVPLTHKAPALDGTDRNWNDIPFRVIAPTNLVQGKVSSDVDSSAIFRLAHDGKTLFIDVQVKDDIVVSNIASNDIRGHWRSDSIEICLDPVSGAEDTLGCYKLGIFPFDNTGVVRAARDADARPGLVEETAPGTRLFSRRTADGYRIQASIPFAEIGVSRPRGRRLGFNLIIYDGDKATAALGENINKSRIAWAARSGVMGRPEDWGRIDLE